MTSIHKSAVPNASVIADAVDIYSKDASGTTQFFARSGAGVEYQLTPPAGGGSGDTQGTVDIVLGSTPVTEATVAVTGQAAILATSSARAWIQGYASADNDENAHLAAGVLVNLTCGLPVAATGFTIYFSVIAGLATGTFRLRWAWK